MKKFIRILAFMIALLGVLSISGCNRSLSYGIFQFDDIDSHGITDYLESADFEYLRIDGIAIIPDIKAISHGVFGLGFMAYSLTDGASYSIHEVELVRDDNVTIYASNDCTWNYSCDEESDGVYKKGEWLTTLSEEELNAVSGQKYRLVITVSAGDSSSVKEITYNANVIQYVTWVIMP